MPKLILNSSVTLSSIFCFYCVCVMSVRSLFYVYDCIIVGIIVV